MNNRHYLAGIVAFVIWGFFSIPLRALQAFPPGEILFFRILFTLGLLLIVIPVLRRKQLASDFAHFRSLTARDKRTAILLTMIGGVLLSFNWLVFIITVNEINIKSASFSYLICPVITAILGFVLLKERLTILQWSAVGVCGVSCILIGLNSAHELQYSLMVAVSYATYLVAQRRNQGFDRLINLGFQILISFVLLCVFSGYLVKEVPSSGYFYGIIMIIAVLFTLIPLFLNLYALNQVNSATIGILMYLNPILNFVVAIVIFRETVNVLQIVGYSLIGIGLLMFNYPYLKRMHSSH